MFTKRLFQGMLVLVLLAASLASVRPVIAGGYCGSVYVVQPGDWMAKIARQCGVTLSELYAANPWVGYYIYPGQVLTIPGGYVPAPTYPCGPMYSEYYGYYYVVCRGDTLSRIARYYGVSVYYLQMRNQIANANLIYAGQFIWP
ncbi:MAG: LysM peptidoglycan-binding domain-containing protein [Candidatus Villigracilaceae bacterium]